MTLNIIEDVDSASYEEVTENLVCWLLLDVEQRKIEMEYIKKAAAFFDELLETAEKLIAVENPGVVHQKQARMLLKMINERRLLDKAPDWDTLSREEQVERVHKSDEKVLGYYFP